MTVGSFVEGLPMLGSTPEMRKQTAIHEAGHAVMDWFQGQGHRIVEIDMRPTLKRHGRVRSLPTHGARWVQLHLSCNNHVAAKLAAVGGITNALAGPAAEKRFTNTLDDWWLSDLFEEWFAEDDDPNHDLGRAVAAAQALYGGTEKRMMRFLKTVAGWTREAIELPTFWTPLEVLAARLENCQTMSGSVVCKTIASAAGPGIIPPINAKWRKRFCGW